MRRNIQIAAGPQAYLLLMYTVRSVMCEMEDCRHLDQNLLWEKVKKGYALRPGSTLAEAMPILDPLKTDWVPVISASDGETPDIVGVLFQVDALKAYNRALAATAREEHS